MDGADGSAATRGYELIKVQPRSGTLGAEIKGVDLSATIDDALFCEIEKAFHDHLVIVLRNQSIQPGDLLAFSKRFGPVEPHPLGSRRGLDGHPEVMVLENKPGKLGPRNDFWHFRYFIRRKTAAWLNSVCDHDHRRPRRYYVLQHV